MSTTGRRARAGLLRLAGGFFRLLGLLIVGGAGFLGCIDAHATRAALIWFVAWSAIWIWYWRNRLSRK